MANFKDRGLYPQSLLRFLASCLRLGMSPLEAIRVFSATFRLSRNKAQDLEQMETLLASGAPVSQALARMRDGSPPWLVRLIRWCEGNGQLVPALDASARLLDLESRVGLAVDRGMAYPLMVSTMMVSLSCMLMLGPWSMIATEFTSMHQYTRVKSEIFCQDFPFLGWLTDWAMRTSADPNLRVLILAGGWGAFLVLWIRASTPGHRALRAFVERLVPGVRASREAARAALQLEITALGLESHIPLVELVRELAPLSLVAGEQETLQGIAQELERGTPPDALVQQPRGPLSTAVVTGGHGGLTPETLRNLAQKLESTALIGLDHMVNLITPFVTVGLMLVLILIPIGQFLSVVRLTSLLSQSLN